MDEHEESVQVQLNPLLERINALDDQLTTKIRQILIGDAQEKLNEWRDESLKLINRFYDKKYDVLQQHYIEKVESSRKNIDAMKATLNRHRHQRSSTQDDIGQFKSTIGQISEELQQIQSSSFKVTTRPLEISEHSIRVEEIQRDYVHLTTIPPAWKTIDCPPQDIFAIGCNEEHLVIQQKSELMLFNKDATVSRRIDWDKPSIRSIVWSSTLNEFILHTSDGNLLLFNSKFESTEPIANDPIRSWHLCACSDTSLFASTYRQRSDLFQFDLLSRFQLIKRWQPPHSCQENERIIDMTGRNKTLALIIQSSSSVRLELRSAETLERLWSTPIEMKVNVNCAPIIGSSLDSTDWVLVDYNASQLLYVSSNGQLKKIATYPYSAPWSAVLLDSKTLVVTTEKSLNFHHL